MQGALCDLGPRLGLSQSAGCAAVRADWQVRSREHSSSCTQLQLRTQDVLTITDRIDFIHVTGQPGSPSQPGTRLVTEGEKSKAPLFSGWCRSSAEACAQALLSLISQNSVPHLLAAKLLMPAAVVNS